MAKRKTSVARRRRRSVPAKRRTSRRRVSVPKGLPIPQVAPTMKVLGGIIAGTVFQQIFDIPLLDERAAGVYAMAALERKNKSTRDALASCAAALQAESLMRDFGLMQQILDFVPDLGG